MTEGLKWQYLTSEKDISEKVAEGTNIRLLDHGSPFEGGILSRCIERNENIYTFVGCQGFAFLPEDLQQRSEMLFPLRITLEKGEGHLNEGAWMYDSYAFNKEGKVEGLNNLSPEEIPRYNIIVKEMDNFAKSFSTKDQLTDFLFYGKLKN